MSTGFFVSLISETTRWLNIVVRNQVFLEKLGFFNTRNDKVAEYWIIPQPPSL
jgi:hypothetical protein